MQDFTFLDPGPLVDDDLTLVLVRRTPGAPQRQEAPSYVFEMRHSASGALMGGINLRVGDYEHLRLYVGHIGYGVDRSCRGRRYAGRSVTLVLPLARRHALTPLWITCNPENIASARSICRAGGVFVEEVDVPPGTPLYTMGDRRKRRYRFDL